MDHLPIPPLAVYIGLAGTLLALLIATIGHGWKWAVFFLLALRLAIGWQFLFEGLHKVNSHLTGPNDTTRPFSSEPYFKVAPGPLGSLMRKQFEDPEAFFAAKLKPTKEIAPADFAKLDAKEQAALCPEAVAKEIDEWPAKVQESIKKDEEDAIKKANDREAEAAKSAKTDEERACNKASAELARQTAKTTAEEYRKALEKLAKDDLLTPAKATYARWVYGVDKRDAKLKGVTNDANFTAPQRLEYLAWLRGELKAADGPFGPGMGNGHTSKKMADMRLDLVAAEGDLVKDTNAFIAELKAGMSAGKVVDVPKADTRGALMDRVTMWFLVGVGSCILAGLFTRPACVLAAGFLIVTYLNHPPFPWYPAPPGTEGNPLFINKNAIECLALLALAGLPTGRWLGLDALVMRLFFGPAKRLAAN